MGEVRELGSEAEGSHGSSRPRGVAAHGGSAGDEWSRLVDAAWTVVERSGFVGVKVQLVVRGAGVSARTFYRHFADKDELLLALLRDEMARAGAHLRTVVGRVDDPGEQVEAWIGAVIGAAGDPRRMARARLFSEQQAVMGRFPGEVEDGVALLQAPLREAIERGCASGAFPWADPARDTALVYRLTGGSLSAALAHGGDAGRHLATVVDATTAFALRALGVAPP